jgi:hypothetical protein
MTPEKHTTQFVETQRELELDWIGQNSELFTAKARGYFGLVGRGALVVDVVSGSLDEGALFSYFTRESMEHIADEAINDMVDGYDPEAEFVVVLLLPRSETRAYRVDIQETKDATASEGGSVEYAGT